MKNSRTFFVRAFTLLFLLISNYSIGQAIIRVRVVSVQTLNNADCDGFLTGNSDFVWEFTGTDNTLGLTNNNPALFGIFNFNYAYLNGNNGPYTITTPSGQVSPSNGIFFDHEYLCAADVPTQINLGWEAYENDDVGNYDVLGLTDGETGMQNVVMATPGGVGTLLYVFNANSLDGGCSQNYRITLEVSRLPLVVSYLEDNICNAASVVLNTTYTYGWCQYTLEPNEPAAADVQTSGSGWFQFVAPPSGAVEITSDLAGTDIGTYFEIYHAADGSSCLTGVQPISAVLIKDKFEYLSHIEFSDGIDLIGIDPEAEIVLDACDPFPGISYQKLIPGETYYVQFTADDISDRGYFEIRVNSFGGSAPDIEDIPCLSSTVVPGTAVISSASSSPVTSNLSFGCAYDGGNNFGETGAVHTSSDPNEYHAYDYDHNAVNNNDVNESVWLNFVAPNNGRMVFETDYQSAIYSESAALFGFDKRFAPGIPSDYSCANLKDLYAVDGALNGLLGGSVESAIINARCLEPGYNYFGMVDPANGLTALATQNIDTWLYDPSIADPVINPPGNDILCLTTIDPLYEVVVTPAGVTPPFQAVAGTNEFACREYLAGEPASDNLIANRADQTVWHYFIAPASGAVEMNIRAYIGLDLLRYSIYELLNGTDCYGGLNPATYTTDGTQTSSIITPLLQGSAGFTGTQESLCCLTPGKIYAIQLDGGSPGDEGQYIIEYIREVASDAGDVFVEMTNGNIIDVPSTDTAFVCFGDSFTPGILLNGIGETTLNIPSCLQLGYVIHSTNPVPDPVANTGFTFIDSVQTANGFFINNTDGTGSFGNPFFNQLYYVSPMADEPLNWGDLTCISSTVEEGVPVVYLQPIIPSSSYNSVTCDITFTSSGGLSAYYGSDFSYTIQNALMNTVAVGTFAAGVNVVFSVPSAEIYTITITDGACPYSFTIDASACSNPCIMSPIISFVSVDLCNGQSVFLEGANQTVAGLYTDTYTAANGCDSTIYTTVSVIDPVVFAQNFTICQGGFISVGTNTYSTSGIYTDILTAANGCDSTVTTTLFVASTLNSNQSVSICEGDTYNFGSSNLSLAGTYTNTLTAAGGCDSIVTLFLSVLPDDTTNIFSTICSGQSYTFAGNPLTTAGTYFENLTSVSGCDSIVRLFLNVDPVITNSITSTICQGQDYIFGSQTLTIAGSYTEMFTTTGGCDSLVTLFLNVNPIISSSFSVTICAGQTYNFGTQTLNAPGTYSEILQTALGCDSLVTLFLNVNPIISSSYSVTICAGQTYTFGTQTLNVSGTYSEILQTALGCDSSVTLFLIVNPTLTSSFSTTVCSGQTYIFGTQTLNSSGTYTNLFQTALGCDSLVTLHLFVDDAIEYYLDTSICEGESFVFGTQSLSVSGLYTELFQTPAGCDSIVHLEFSAIDCAGTFEISNILTPNDDGQNDTWKISDYSQISGCTVTIFNRWGQPVYESTDYQNEWAGTKDGELLPDGVYYYSIKCLDTEYKGTVNLFRFKK